MKRLLCFAVLSLALIVTAQAQYRPTGPPASVTSAQPNPVTGAPLATPGATVTSGRFSPVFPPTVRVPHNRHGHGGDGRGRNGQGRFGTQFTPAWAYEPGFIAVPVPVPVDQNGNPIAMTDAEAAAQAEEADQEEAPAYTVFERRSRSAVPLNDYSDLRASMRARPQAAPEMQQEQPIPDQPATVLIFRDGRQLEITNYAIQSGTLFNLSDSGPRKIALADLDMDKTVKVNDERGVDFTLPTTR